MNKIHLSCLFFFFTCLFFSRSFCQFTIDISLEQVVELSDYDKKKFKDEINTKYNSWENMTDADQDAFKKAHGNKGVTYLTLQKLEKDVIKYQKELDVEWKAEFENGDIANKEKFKEVTTKYPFLFAGLPLTFFLNENTLTPSSISELQTSMAKIEVFSALIEQDTYLDKLINGNTTRFAMFYASLQEQDDEIKSYEKIRPSTQGDREGAAIVKAATGFDPFEDQEDILDGNIRIYNTISIAGPALFELPGGTMQYQYNLIFSQDDFGDNKQIESEAIRLQHGVLDVLLSRKLETISSDARSAEDLFNGFLWYKSYLSTLRRTMRQAMWTKKYPVIEDIFKTWKVSRAKLSYLFQFSQADLRGQLERELENTLKENNHTQDRIYSVLYNNGVEPQDIRWRDVQKSLKEKEAVVEMIRFQKYGQKKITDSVFYLALIVRPDSPSPIPVIFQDGNKMENEFFKEYVDLRNPNKKTKSNNVYTQFWKPIQDKLSGVERVYFSPDGIYQMININTIPVNNKSYLIDQLDIRNLNSTRALVEKMEDKSLGNKSAVLIGDPVYSDDQSFLSEYYKGLNIPTPLSSLEDSAVEIENIGNVLNENGFSITKYTGASASESAFNWNKAPDIIHVAAHAFFKPVIELSYLDEYARKNKYGMLSPELLTSLGGLSISQFEINPFLRSTIALSTPTNKNDSNDDGLLTAYELSTVNLSSTELLSLSACETGKGEIRGSGQEITGFTSAAFEAGAKRLAITLWKVQDYVAQEFFTSFYSKVADGEDYPVAFRKAQLEIKKTYPEPYLWGAFLLTQRVQ